MFRATVPLGAPVDNLPPAKNFIDELVFTKLKTLGMPPSAVCDDATFIRRVTIDIAGRLPTPDEAQQFLADTDPRQARQADRPAARRAPTTPITSPTSGASVLAQQAAARHARPRHVPVPRLDSREPAREQALRPVRARDPRRRRARWARTRRSPGIAR